MALITWGHDFAKFLWGNVLLGGKQQIDAKKSNFWHFESTVYMKSMSMPLILEGIYISPPPRSGPMWVYD